MDIEPEEISDARDMLKDVVQAFAFPQYELTVQYGDGSSQTHVGGTSRGTITLPPVELSEAEKGFLADHCNALIDAQEAEDASERPHVGDLCEINGFEYVVVSEHIDGDLELSLRDELQDDEDLPTIRTLH